MGSTQSGGTGPLLGGSRWPSFLQRYAWGEAIVFRRESDAIEQEADLVSFLYRPAYYGLASTEEGTPVTENMAQLIISKHRNGPLGKVELCYEGKLTRFTAAETAEKSAIFG